MASIAQSLTEQDTEAVSWLADTDGNALTLPEVIPFKETLCVLAARGLDVPVKTPADMLRLAVCLWGGDRTRTLSSTTGKRKRTCHATQKRGLLLA